MGGFAGPELVAAVSNARGFGILPCAYSTPEQIGAQIDAVRKATTRPFGVNVFVETLPYAADANQVLHAHERLRRYREELGIPHPAAPAHPPDRYEAQLDAILAARPAVFTFTFGIPHARVLERLRAAGIFAIGTATTVDEALALERAGVDALFAQGAEAGAHRGTFLAPVEESLIGTLALVPQVVDAIRLPVIAAGGIGDGRAVAAVLALGARAAAIGTSFLLANESTISAAHRAALQTDPARTTVLTRAFSGRTARGVPNRFIREANDPDDIAPYPYQNAMTRDIRTAAAAQGRSGVPLALGRASRVARDVEGRRRDRRRPHARRERRCRARRERTRPALTGARLVPRRASSRDRRSRDDIAAATRPARSAYAPRTAASTDRAAARAR